MWCIVLGLLATRAAGGKAPVVYVSGGADGNDTNPGTKAKPLQSVAMALQKIAAGGSLYLSGIFETNETLSVAVAGVTVDKWPGRPTPEVSGGWEVPMGLWKWVSSPSEATGYWEATLPIGCAVSNTFSPIFPLPCSSRCCVPRKKTPHSP